MHARRGPQPTGVSIGVRPRPRPDKLTTWAADGDLGTKESPGVDAIRSFFETSARVPYYQFPIREYDRLGVTFTVRQHEPLFKAFLVASWPPSRGAGGRIAAASLILLIAMLQPSSRRQTVQTSLCSHSRAGGPYGCFRAAGTAKACILKEYFESPFCG